MTSGLQSPRLSLAEAYLVAQSFLGHIRAVPSRVEEPVDGVVELEGAGMMSRVKYQRNPIGQGAIIALLKAADSADLDLAMFSVTGFSDSAISFAASRAIALFDLTADGDVVPVTTAARAMMIEDPFVSPLDPAAYTYTEPDFEPSPDEGADFFIFEPATKQPSAAPPTSWRECPRCGTKHHQSAQFCAACGTDLTKRSSALLPADSPPAKPIPRAAPGAPTLRCKTCGSHDIELVPGS
ncbi:MAG: zinc ribbon domain-containing protein [Acidimicrobiia bacterium]|nr:zinc ribbon domain-containing protein [Acidimicrobiia bacterium]